VKGADAVVHLAFTILSASDSTRELNVDGSRRVFEAAVKAGVQRICYASSVAAYGFHEDNPTWLTEDVPARGTPGHPYSAQKAEVEHVLAEVLRRRRRTVAYTFRPCIVAGPGAQTVLDEIPYVRLSEKMPDVVVALLRGLPALKPVVPDPGTRFQLVHEDDVAAAFVAGVRGKGAPGPYNLAGGGALTMSDFASALGWYSIPVPELALNATAEVVSRLPLPAATSWVHSVRTPVLMKTDRAKKELGWRPKHSSRATLQALVGARREAALTAR
jgi:nucleoside-diphosphate-sugar epimerase